MKLTTALAARLTFLGRVTDKECRHLQDTDTRLFSTHFSPATVSQIAADPLLA